MNGAPSALANGKRRRELDHEENTFIPPGVIVLVVVVSLALFAFLVYTKQAAAALL